MIQAVVTDIEGTTSSLAFVKDVLFPYAREHIGEFIGRHADEAQVAAAFDEIRAIMQRPAAGPDEIAAQLIEWMDRDEKVTPLKALQGLVWEYGYRNNEFHGHIYDDAARALRAWHEQGIGLYVFSSGSTHAQRLLFAHTPFGDLTPLFDGFFDTRIGQKRDPDAYRHIAGRVGAPGERILFLSDIEAELDAARAAGLRTAWLVRDADPDPKAAHRQVRDFNEIHLDCTAEH